MKFLISRSKPVKAVAYLKRVTLDLVKVRREAENAGKVNENHLSKITLRGK